MKKTVLFLCALAWALVSNAQTCERDSSILLTGAIVSPWYWTPDSPYIQTKPACINEFYSQSVTFNVPDTIENIPGVPLAIPINNLFIATSNAISNLPAGLTYSCDPPNCVFNKNTLGCVLLYGTPTGPVDTADLSIKVSISSPSFPVPVGPLDFPSIIAPDAHYYIEVRNTGECAVGTNDPSAQIASVKNIPNPFSDQTAISIVSNVSGDFNFEVFNLTGQRIHSQQVGLLTGPNQFTFDAGDLPNGAYYYTIGNAAGKVSRMMVIAKR
ncbi:MAG: T9SS type A sorting domain-containing protein [Lewinellaceae bacterium]|nr:T9SS type A sorting domain-containing protein [Lewinellaceae bacterium]